MLITLHIFPTAIEEGSSQYEQQCKSCFEVKGQIYLEASHQKPFLEAAEGEQRCFHIVEPLLQVKNGLLYESTKSTYFIKYSLKDCKVASSFPQHPTILYGYQVILLKTRPPLTEHFHIFTKCFLEVAV